MLVSDGTTKQLIGVHFPYTCTDPLQIDVITGLFFPRGFFFFPRETPKLSEEMTDDMSRVSSVPGKGSSTCEWHYIIDGCLYPWLPTRGMDEKDTSQPVVTS